MKNQFLAIVLLAYVNTATVYSQSQEGNQLVDNLWTSYKLKSKLEARELEMVSGLRLDQVSHAQAMKLALIKADSNQEISAEEFSFLNSSNEWNEDSFSAYEELKEDFERARFSFKEIEFTTQDNLSPDHKSNKKRLPHTNDRWSKAEIRELLSFKPKWKFGSTEFRNTTNLYLFCRSNRNYPCRMIMRNENGKLMKTSSGQIWSQPKLAMSGQGLTYEQSNGNTPQGLFTIDSVMPAADQQNVFGKYRRLKLDFIERSKNEKKLLYYIPEELQQMGWWKESVIARDNGRSLFRVHGVGVKNLLRDSPYYPFVPTAGCIASLEGEYDGVDYKDQRILLDTFMVSMGLKPEYRNETKLKGLLYVVNIDDEERPVELDDIL
jgi:hypothetical protein